MRKGKKKKKNTKNQRYLNALSNFSKVLNVESESDETHQESPSQLKQHMPPSEQHARSKNKMSENILSENTASCFLSFKSI